MHVELPWSNQPSTEFQTEKRAIYFLRISLRNVWQKGFGENGTSNIQQGTSNIQWSAAQTWMLGVRCWTFLYSPRPP
jgi:hypothetical protein